MDAAVVTVGDELLAGRTTNTNATWLCEQLTERGVRVERITTVPDRVSDIARVVNEYRAEYDRVIVTGGIGPTHDDVTMAGVAAAFGRMLEENEDARAWLTDHVGYTRADLVDGTATLPKGAKPIHNDVGVAPGAVVDTVYVFPGVPQEMQAMFESVAHRFEGTRRPTETVVADEPESALLDRIEAVRDRFDVEVGSYPGQYVRLVLTGQEPEEIQRAADWLRSQVELPDSTA